MFWKRRKHDIAWLTGDIAVGARPSANDWPSLHAEGVRGVVDLCAESSDNQALVAASSLSYTRLPVVEGDAPELEDLRSLTSWIAEHVNTTGPVLVHCREGRGRSAMVAAASLVRLGLPLAEAYRLLMQKRPSAAINAKQLALLENFAKAVNAGDGQSNTPD